MGREAPSLHVREQHRHLLALAFKCAFRGENLLGEVFGSVRFDGTELSCGYQRFGRSFEQSLSALLAKFRAEPGCSTAIWADNFNPRAAVLTEYRVARILGLALQAVHIDVPSCRVEMLKTVPLT